MAEPVGRTGTGRDWGQGLKGRGGAPEGLGEPALPARRARTALGRRPQARAEPGEGLGGSRTGGTGYQTSSSNMCTYILIPDHKNYRGDIVDIVTEPWAADGRWVVGERSNDGSTTFYHRTYDSLEAVCFSKGLSVEEVRNRKIGDNGAANTCTPPFRGPMIINGAWCPHIRAAMSGAFQEVPAGRFQACDEVPDGLGAWVRIPKLWRGKRIDGSLPVRRRVTARKSESVASSSRPPPERGGGC
jgi:hypothetical protein